MSLLPKFHFLLSQIKGFKTTKKIVVIESDDWGSIRMPNKRAVEELQKSNPLIEKNPHCLLDCLENREDIEMLLSTFDELSAITNNKPPKLTLNYVMVNPDFERIKKDNFLSYYYEPFTETYQKEARGEETFKLIKEGINQSYFYPQFHAREHINAFWWLGELRKGNTDFINAFQLGCYGIDSNQLPRTKKNLMATYEYVNDKEKDFVDESIIEGLNIFKEEFGFTSYTSVPPRYTWCEREESILNEAGVKSIQTALIQSVPSNGVYTKKRHFTGQKSKSGLNYSVRNAHFEPAYNQQYDWVNAVIKKADLAFMLKTPLIISTHRINFSGGIRKSNRDENLKQFKKMITQLVKKYPDIEFLNSEELARLILKDNVRN